MSAAFSEPDFSEQDRQQAENENAWRRNPAPLEKTLKEIISIINRYGVHEVERLEKSPSLLPDLVPAALYLRERRYEGESQDFPVNPPYDANIQGIHYELRKCTHGPWCWAGVSLQAVNDALAKGKREGLISEFDHDGIAYYQLAIAATGTPAKGGDDYAGYVSADTLAIDGIRANRLSEEARAGNVRTQPAPKGLKDSQGREIRTLYHRGDAETHCKPKRHHNPKPKHARR